MDATPSYVWLDYVPELVQRSYTKKELAKKKFLLLLREPVQRQYSEYQRVLRLCLRAYDAARYRSHRPIMLCSHILCQPTLSTHPLSYTLSS